MFRQIASYLNSQLCKTPSLCNDNKNLHKRQIFITVSRSLRDKVKDYFFELRKSVMFAGKKRTIAQFHEYKKKNKVEDTIIIENRPNSFCKLKDHHFPLFITYDEFSEMLRETYGIQK